MSKYLLVLEEKDERRRCLNAIKQVGARINHDSSSRVVLIDAKDKKAVEDVLPKGAKLVDASEDITKTIKDIDESEALFLGALKRRYSKKYRAMKDAQKPGESKEEIDFFSAPHTPED